VTLDPRENPLLNKQQPTPPGYYPLTGIPVPPPPAQVPPPPAPVAPTAGAGGATAFPTVKTALDAPAASKKKEPVSALAGTIDTVEAVIIALILALVFRAFFVEAFVIPTGSMAPTLLGAHFDVICPKCGFAYKESADVSWQLQNLTRASGGTYTANLPQGQIGHAELSNSETVLAPRFRSCPNCGYAIPADLLPGNPITVQTGEPQSRKIPWANNGDRILVLKYLYDFVDPQRWDVIVFKEPQEGQDNFIKRLIGRPGETVEIIDGDIFIADAGTKAELIERGDFPIARKPRWVQDTVWQAVYDNDFYPIDAPSAANPAGEARENATIGRSAWTWRTPWHAQGETADGWKLNGPLVAFGADKPGTVVFENTPGMTYRYLLNMIGYNAVADWGRLNSPAGGTTNIAVKDVQLKMSWKPVSAAAANLRVVVGAPSNQYRFTWNGGDKKLLLERFDEAKQTFADVGATPVSDPGVPQAGTWYTVAVDNADHAAHVYVDGKLVFEDTPRWTAAEAAELASRPNHMIEFPTISVTVGGAAEITHLKLQHDLYYTQAEMNGPARARQGAPLTLDKDQFFAMGDNSPYSFDGRYWSKAHPSLMADNIPEGIVPRRFLLGRAFFVYWPAGFRPMNGAAPDSLRFADVPLVPNTGEMRFIR